MTELLDTIKDALERLDLLSVLDILIIAAIIYWMLLLVRGTTAMAVLRGVAIVAVLVLILGRLLDLTLLNWLIDRGLPALLIAIPIVFQPEIRRGLERVGRGRGLVWAGRPTYEDIIDIVANASLNLSQKHHGALMVLERETGLEEYIDTGVKVDATVSPQLLEGIFMPRAPLHDGAVILREDRVVAAACTLPLSQNAVPGHLGTRHRAAVGITELTDAVSVVVSEETGGISVAANGRLISQLDETRLRAVLLSLFRSRQLAQRRRNGRAYSRSPRTREG